MDIGKRITYFRQQKNITVNKLANMAGISQSYLRDLELGKKQPTVEYLSYICDALNISLSTFFTDEKATNEFIFLLNQLTEEQKNSLLAFMKSIAHNKNS